MSLPSSITSSQQEARTSLLARKRHSINNRRYQRIPCFAIGFLMLSDGSLSIHGVVNEISKGGIRFRPASTYLLHRTGASLTIRVDDLTFNGKIVASRPTGYGVQLYELLEDDEVAAFVSIYPEE